MGVWGRAGGAQIMCTTLSRMARTHVCIQRKQHQHARLAIATAIAISRASTKAMLHLPTWRRRPFLTWHGDVATPRIVSLGRNNSSLHGPAGLSPVAATSRGGSCRLRLSRCDGTAGQIIKHTHKHTYTHTYIHTHTRSSTPPAPHATPSCSHPPPPHPTHSFGTAFLHRPLLTRPA